MQGKGLTLPNMLGKGSRLNNSPTQKVTSTSLHSLLDLSPETFLASQTSPAQKLISTSMPSLLDLSPETFLASQTSPAQKLILLPQTLILLPQTLISVLLRNLAGLGNLQGRDSSLASAILVLHNSLVCDLNQRVYYVVMQVHEVWYTTVSAVRMDNQ